MIMLNSILVSVIIASALADVNFLLKPNGGRYVKPKRVAQVPPPVQRGANLPQGSPGPVIAILRNDLQMGADGYQYAYETQNGISAQEQASIRPTGPEQATKSTQGSFTWTSPEGEVISVTYIADENGYQPQGSHIPTPPPIPVEIQKALEYIAANPPQPEKQPLRRY